MNENILFLNMFPDYEPPETLKSVLSQAAIVAADLDPATRRIFAAIHSPQYIPARILTAVQKDICQIYDLQTLELTATHPADQLHNIEPEELMALFVSQNSMTRGSLAGAKWEWEDDTLVIRLRANGKQALEECSRNVQAALQERFETPVQIRIEAGQALEGEALYDAMEKMRTDMLGSLPSVPAERKKEAPAPVSEAFYGKPFKGPAVPMMDLALNMKV